MKKTELLTTILLTTAILMCNKSAPIEDNANSVVFEMDDCSSCNLPRSQDEGISIDSTYLHKSNSWINGSMEIDIGAKIKNAVNVFVKGKVEPKEYVNTTQKVVSVVIHSHPEAIEYVNLLKDIYCAYYQVICSDSLLNQNEKNTLYTKQLAQINQEIRMIYRSRLELNYDENIREEQSSRKGGTTLQPVSPINILPENYHETKKVLKSDAKITFPKKTLLFYGEVRDQNANLLPCIIVKTKAGDFDTTNTLGEFEIYSSNREMYSYRIPITYFKCDGSFQGDAIVTLDSINPSLLELKIEK